jgi:hypothetical protein
MAAEFGEYLFRVGEGADRGKPVFLWLELRKGPSISVFENALVTLRLREDQDIREAEEVARYLNKHIKAVGYQPL